MTGTTVPEWDVMFMLDGGISPQDYFQTIFRVQSSNKAAGKEQCVVIDYNPQRNLQMIYEYAYVLSQPSGKTTREMMAEFLDFAPVLDHTGNKPVHVNVEDILEAVAHTSNSIEKFGSSANFHFENVTEDIITSLQGIAADVSSKRGITVNNNGIGIGNNYGSNSEDDRSPENAIVIDLTDKANRELRQKATTMIKLIPNYIWLTGSTAESVEELLAEQNGDTFIREVGISIADLKTMCDSKFINIKRVNLCIMSYQSMQRQLFPELTT
jgi:hypothetical protein